MLPPHGIWLVDAKPYTEFVIASITQVPWGGCTWWRHRSSPIYGRTPSWPVNKHKCFMEIICINRFPSLFMHIHPSNSTTQQAWMDICNIFNLSLLMFAVDILYIRHSFSFPIRTAKVAANVKKHVYRHHKYRDFPPRPNFVNSTSIYLSDVRSVSWNWLSKTSPGEFITPGKM